MTGDLGMMMKFRDVQMMEDVSKKAALGYFDVEFTMYGCAYLDPVKDKVFYKVSSRSVDIYTFIEESAKENIFPSKVETMTVKCPVPLGTRELIANDVKKELAKKLQKKYSKKFFSDLYQLAETLRSNIAGEILWNMSEDIEGVFDEERLNQFEKLVAVCYEYLKLTKDEYRALCSWIAEERRSMDDSFISKDRLEKTMYGFGYEEDGKLKYFSNANQGHVYEKCFMLEQKGLFVLPIFQKTYWYNYSINAQEIIKKYKNELSLYYNREYFDLIKGIKSNWLIEYDQLQAVCEKILNQYGEDAYLTVKYYLHHWGIYST